MPVLAICPHCYKTINVERTAKLACPDCGEEFGFAELQKNKLLVDPRVEARELSSAKNHFVNADFAGAYGHFKKALAANLNSYTAQYFVALCDIYLHETNKSFDVMNGIVSMTRNALTVMSRSNAPVADKLTFIKAMLSDVKIIVTRRLASRDKLFDSDIEAYRKVSIADLEKLLELFKIDRELIMSFAPEVTAALVELVECAVKTCYKAVQTVEKDGELFSPNDEIYKKLLSLCNDYCFFGHSLDSKFDGNNFSPDFKPNYAFNEKVLARMDKFDEANKPYEKKRLIGFISEYENMLADCETALRFTYLNCYRSMCSRQNKQHAKLFFDGLKLVYRLLFPRVVMNDKKLVEVRFGKFVDIVDWCDILTRFLVDSYEIDNSIADRLHDFYEKLYEIIDMYVVPDIERIEKAHKKLQNARDAELEIYRKVLFDAACCCAPALKKYVDFSVGKDKTRAKIVKVCKMASEDFLMLSEFKIGEIEQSNFYRPILQISTALLDEEQE